MSWVKYLKGQSGIPFIAMRPTESIGEGLLPKKGLFQCLDSNFSEKTSGLLLLPSPFNLKLAESCFFASFNYCS